MDTPDMPTAHASKSARDLSASYTRIFPKVASHLENAAVFSNLESFNPSFHRHYQSVVFASRVANIEEIGLVQFAEGTTVLGREGYPVRAGGFMVEEQIAPWLKVNATLYDGVANEMNGTAYIDQECLLLARFGEGTWGHWLGEILPRAVIAEHFFPGRFSFAVPAWTTSDDSTMISAATLSSLRAYGIDRSRLVQLSPSECYRFRSLSTVTSVRSDSAMHPGALDLMRANVSASSNSFEGYLPSRVALLRQDVGRRTISNFDEVASVLKSKGFLITETGRLSFEAQVAVFRAAHDLFCVLGSGLTNVIFSPDNLNVLAPAPEAWGDSFFYPLVQARKGKFADIRGPLTSVDQHIRRDSHFSVPIAQLERALDVMRIL